MLTTPTSLLHPLHHIVAASAPSHLTSSLPLAYRPVPAMIHFLLLQNRQGKDASRQVLLGVRARGEEAAGAGGVQTHHQEGPQIHQLHRGQLLLPPPLHLSSAPLLCSSFVLHNCPRSHPRLRLPSCSASSHPAPFLSLCSVPSLQGDLSSLRRSVLLVLRGRERQRVGVPGEHPPLRGACSTSFFASVCELDLVFNFYKIYSILDEVYLGGEIQETSKRVILERLQEIQKLE